MIRRDRIPGPVKDSEVRRGRLTGKISLKSPTDSEPEGIVNLDFSDSANSGHIITLGL